MVTNQRMLFPEPATMIQEIRLWEDVKEHKNLRLPWIHNKVVLDLDFHSMKIISRKNHAAVP